MRPYVSGSGLPLVSKCAAAGVLPRVAHVGTRDKIGNALHDHCRERSAWGVSSAIARLPEIALRWHLDERETAIFRGRAMAFEYTPPRPSLPEIALCYMRNGTVVQTEGGRGHYPNLPEGFWLPTQIDIMWADPFPLYTEILEGGARRVRCPPGSVLWVADYKSGDERYVDPAERNAQVLAGMVLAARWTGAQQAIPAIIYVRRGPGVWDTPDHVYTAHEIDQAELQVRGWLGRVDEAREAYGRGEALPFVVGPHCEFCDSQTYCQAKTAALKRYLDDPSPLAPTQLTEDQAVRLATLEPQIGRFHDLTTEALRAYVEATGMAIPLANGRAWGAYYRSNDEIDAEIALRVLGDEIGERAARTAFATETSKAALERAIKSAHKREGIERQGAAAMRRVMARIREAGGIQSNPRTCYGVHVPAPVEATMATIVEGIPVEVDGDPEPT